VSEFVRMVDLREIGDAPVRLKASEAECAALARRFLLMRIHHLRAELSLTPEGQRVDAIGTLRASIIQSCAVSGEDLAVEIAEPLHIRFVPEGAPGRPDEEIELAADDLDTIDYAGTAFDLGEAVAQSLALAIDPFATGPQADAARRKAGIVGEGATGAFAGLAAFKDKLGK
jgi:hypothetical protein